MPNDMSAMPITCPSGGKNEINSTPVGRKENSLYERNVLITGGAGFIGSHVVIYFVKHYPQYRIVNFDKLTYASSLRNVASVEKEANYKFIHGDICDETALERVFREEKIDTVLHFAAHTHVDISFWSPVKFTHTNVYGTHVLLETARKFNVGLFMHISSDEVYGGLSQVALSENCVMKPTNPYAASKAAAECIVQSYWESFKFPVIITRANNIYGPHQYPEKVIPKFISLLENDGKCCIYGKGEARRAFLYATDAAEAFDTILHKGSIGETYNIGTDFEMSVMTLATSLIKKIKGVTDEEEVIKYISLVKDRPLHDFAYPLDWSKLRHIGWQPRVSWEEGIQITMDWYRNPANRAHWNNSKEALVAEAHSLGEDERSASSNIT